MGHIRLYYLAHYGWSYGCFGFVLAKPGYADCTRKKRFHDILCQHRKGSEVITNV